jgi:hypothetical protein
MQIDLNDEEARVLRELLDGMLPDLKREIARAEDRVFRHQLVLRQELAERLAARLGSGTTSRM